MGSDPAGEEGVQRIQRQNGRQGGDENLSGEWAGWQDDRTKQAGWQVWENLEHKGLFHKSRIQKHRISEKARLEMV